MRQTNERCDDLFTTGVLNRLYFSHTLLGEEPFVDRQIFAIERRLFELALPDVSLREEDNPLSHESLGLDISSLMTGTTQVGGSSSSTTDANIKPAPILPHDAEDIPYGADGSEVAVFESDGWYIIWRATGELRQLAVPEPGCIWALGRTQVLDGLGLPFVAQHNPTTGETHHWHMLEEIFTQRLVRAEANAPESEKALPEEERGLMVVDGLSGATSWRSEARATKVVRGWKAKVKPTVNGLPAPVHLTGKIWVYQIERAPWMHTMWEMVWFARHLGDHATQSSFMRDRNVAQYEKLAKDLGLGVGHYQPPTRGVRQSATKSGKNASGDDLQELVPEMCASTVGICLGLLLFACPINDKHRTDSEKVNGRAALKTLALGLWVCRRSGDVISACPSAP